MPASVVDLKALIVSPDPKAAALFARMFEDLGVIAQSCGDHASAYERFTQAKFEAVVLDLDTILERVPFVQTLRQSRTNRNAVVLAVATSDSAKRRASEHGASFVVERPLAEERLLPVLRATYGFMLQDRRRYFRLVIELAVSVRTKLEQSFSARQSTLAPREWPSALLARCRKVRLWAWCSPSRIPVL